MSKKPHAAGDHGEKHTSKPGPAAKAEVHHEVYGQAPKGGHEKAKAKEVSHVKHPVPKEATLTKFLHQAVKQGEKFVGKILGIKPHAPEKQHAGADKLTPKERAHHKVTEYTDPKTQRSYHYDNHGRVDHIKAKNKTEVAVHYRPGDTSNKPANFAVINAKHEVVAKAESSKNVAISIDQRTGDIQTNFHDFAKVQTDSGEKAIPVTVANHHNAEGLVTSVSRDFSGKRLEKHTTGPDRKLLSQTRYHHLKNEVIASQTNGEGQLTHQFVYTRAADVEKQDPIIRIDHAKERNLGVTREQTDTYNLHKDAKHPINKIEKISDLNQGKFVVSEQNFDGKKQLDHKVLTLDEMGRSTSLRYTNESEKVDVSIGFTKGKPENVSGNNGGIDKASLLQMAEKESARIHASQEIKAMDHGELLAVRGPSTPRAGEKPTGTVVYREGNEFVQHNVREGIIYDGNKKIGTVKDNGQVEVGDQSFNINDHKGRAGVFTGRGSDGRYLDLTGGRVANAANPRSEGFSGYISNGQEKMLTVGGHIFAPNNKFFGQVDSAGNVEAGNNLDQQEKDQTRLSALLKGYQFNGNENGLTRQFNLDRTSHGDIFIPLRDQQGELKKGPDGKFLTQACEVRLGMIIDKKTNEQIGKLMPPVQNQDGSLTDGLVEIHGKEVALSSLKNTVFKITLDDQNKEIHGAVLGPTERQADGTLRPDVGGIVNLDACLANSKENFEAKNKIYNAALEDQKKQNTVDGIAQGIPGLGAPLMAVNEYSKLDNVTFDAKTTAQDLAAKQHSSNQSAIEKMLEGGIDENTIYKIQKMDQFNKKENYTPVERLKAANDGANHELEKVATNSFIDGEFRRPDLTQAGLITRYDVRQSIIYKKDSDVVVGNVDASSGKLALFDDRGRQERVSGLADPALKGSSLHFRCTDAGGTERKLDWINDGQGRIQSVDQLRKQVAQERAYAELRSSCSTGTTSGEPVEQLERTKVLEKRYNETLNKIVTGGVTDANKADCGFSSLEILRGGPKEFVRAEHNKAGRHYSGPAIEVPPLDTAACARASGQMRIGHEHYLARAGAIYRTSFDPQKHQWVPQEKPCGQLQPGYRAQIDGKIIELQNDSNFLFKMQLAGDDKERWIMGLGEARKDPSGKLIAGGLTDAKEFMRRSDEARREIERSAKEYNDNQSWGPLGWAVDRGYFAGREEQLNQINHVTGHGQKLVEKQLQQLFGEGLESNTLATIDAEHNVRSMQNRLIEMNISATDSASLSRDGQNVQAGVREGVAMAAIAIVTGGTSLLVSAGTVTMGTGLGIATAGGALSSALIRQTKGGDQYQFINNAASGGLEGVLMFTGGNIGQVAKNLTTVGKSGKLLEVIAEEQRLAKIQAVAGDGKLYARLETLAEMESKGAVNSAGNAMVKQMAGNPELAKLAGMINNGEGAQVKALCEILSDKKTTDLMLKAAAGGPKGVEYLGYASTASNAYYQSIGFSTINAFKTGSKEELTFTKLAEGGAFMLAGEMATSLIHMPFGPRWNPDIKIRGLEVGKFVDGMITSYPDAVINNSIFSALTARAGVTDVEKQNIADELHLKDKSEVTDEMFETHKNKSRMDAYVWAATFEGAAMTGLSHPFTHPVTHYLGQRLEKREQNHRAETLDTVLIRDHEGQLKQVSLPDGTVLTQSENKWSGNREHPVLGDHITAVESDGRGNLSIKHSVDAETKISKEGVCVERRRTVGAGEGEGIVKTFHPDGKSYSIESKDGNIVSIKIENLLEKSAAEETKFHYEDGKLTSVEPFAGARLSKDESGWSLYYNGKLAEKGVYSHIEVLDGGTVVKEGKSRINGKEFSTIEKIDGSKVTTKNGLVETIVDGAAIETRAFRDSDGKLEKLQLSAGADLVRSAKGWDIVVDGIAEPYCKDIKIESDGTVHHLRELGVITTRHLDGKQTSHVPGDSVGPIDLHLERAKFDTLLENSGDKLIVTHIRDSMLDIHDRLRKEPKSAEEKMARVYYEANRLLDVTGHIEPKRRQQWLDEALSLAANPDFVSQGDNPTCPLAAAEQREYALHPDTWLKTLRRLNETGAAFNQRGEIIENFVKSGHFTLKPDEGAREHYKDNRTRVDGQRLEVSQIVQTVLEKVVRIQHPERKSLFYSNEIEPMMRDVTGREEKFVVAYPKDAHDLATQLLAIKEKGNLYAIVEMDISHLGAGGLDPNRGHVRIAKDIRATDTAEDFGSGLPRERFGENGLPIKKATDGTYELDTTRMEIVFGNSWNKSASHDVMSVKKAYDTTLFAVGEEHIKRLEDRLKANSGEPYDLHERVELLSWQVGLLNAAIVNRINKKINSTAEAALERLGAVDGTVEPARLLKELSQCEEQLREKYSSRAEKLVTIDSGIVNSEKVNLDHIRLQAGIDAAYHVNDLIEGRRGVNESGSNLTLKERKYLADLGELKRAVIKVEELRNEMSSASLKMPQAAEALPGIVDNSVSRAVAAFQEHSPESNGRVLSPQMERLLAQKYENKRRSLADAAGIDMVTGYSNYNGLMSHLEQKLAAGEGGYLLSIDVRRFKLANDCMGRDGADDALRYLTTHAARVVGLKEGELLARSGGDEIVVHLSANRTPEEIKALVTKLDEVTLACRGYNEPDAQGRTYGMKLVEPTHPDFTNGNQPELLIKLAIGAVRCNPGDTAHHAMDRADALMNERKSKQEKKESPENIPQAFVENYDVEIRNPQRPESGPARSEIERLFAPQLQTLTELQKFHDLAEPKKLAHLHHLQNQIEKHVVSGDLKSVLEMRTLQNHLEKYKQIPKSEQENYKRNLEAQYKRYENLSPENRTLFLERRQALDKMWLNPQTKNPAFEVCQRYLRRSAEMAERNNGKAGGRESSKKDRFSIIKADLDNMKGINDQIGHDQGNVLLKHAGDYLRARVPHDCFIGSPGGGGFVIVAPNAERRVQVETILKEYGKKSNALFVPDINLGKIKDREGKVLDQLQFGFSVGSAEYDPALMKKAPPLPEVDVNTAHGASELIKRSAEIRANRDEVIAALSKQADSACDQEKVANEQANVRMRRIPKYEEDKIEWEKRKLENPSLNELEPEPLVFKREAPAGGFDQWSSLLDQKTKRYVSKDEFRREGQNFKEEARKLQLRTENAHEYAEEYVRPRDTNMGALLYWSENLNKNIERERAKYYQGKLSADDIGKGGAIPDLLPNSYRKFVREVETIVEQWKEIDPGKTAAEKQTEIQARVAQLQEAVKEIFEEFGVSAPIIKSATTAELDDAHADYIKGSGIVRLHESQFTKPGKFEIPVLAHESFGHHVQDHLVSNVFALDLLRSAGHENLNHLIEFENSGASASRLTAEGKRFCEEIAKNDPTGRGAFLTDKEFAERIFFASAPWLNARLGKSHKELLSDGDYVAGHRFIDSFKKMYDYGKDQNRSLINVAMERPVRSDSQSDEAHQILRFVADDPRLRPPADFDAVKALKEMTRFENRDQLYGYDPFGAKLTSDRDGKGEPISPRIDTLYQNLLNNPEFFQRHPEFLTKLIDCNTEHDAKTRLKLRNEWLDIIKGEYPEQEVSVPLQARALARFDLIAYKTAVEHFKSGGGPLGHLEQKQFEAQLPELIYKLVGDNIKINYHGSFSRYLFSIHEQRARLVQDAFQRIIDTRDVEDRPEAEGFVGRQLNNGKVLIPDPGKGKQRIKALSENPDGEKEIAKHDQTVLPPPPTRRISLASKDLPDQIRLIEAQHNLAKMQLIQRLQMAVPEPALNFKESGGIPEGYMNQAQQEKENASQKDNGSPKQSRQNQQQGQRQERDAATHLTSGDDLAPMPEPRVDGENKPMPPLPPIPLEQHQKLEALRIQRQFNANNPYKKLPD